MRKQHERAAASPPREPEQTRPGMVVGWKAIRHGFQHGHQIWGWTPPRIIKAGEEDDQDDRRD